MKKLITLFFISGLIGVFVACEEDQITAQKISQPTPITLQYPAYFPPPVDFPDNPLTKEGIKLGRHLFYDPRLSGDSTQSCADCHLQANSFSDFNQFSTGIDGIEGDLNAMAIVNLAWGDHFFWNGRSTSLEEQALEPVVNPIEMHETWSNVIEKLERDPKYVQMFKDAFGEGNLDSTHASKAIAQFERTMISANSKYDQGYYLMPQFSNFDSIELYGRELFNNEIGDCFHCHQEPLFGAYGALQFSNNGLDSLPDLKRGREEVSGNPLDYGKFRIPTLRNVEFTFPWMHDGRFNSLQEVIEHYNMGGHWSPTIDPNMKAVGTGKNWTPGQKAALIAFMKTLTDFDYLQDTAFSDPFQ